MSWRLVAGASWVVLWALLPTGPADAVPALGHVLAAGTRLWQSGLLAADLLASVQRVAAGVALALAAAVLAAAFHLARPALARAVLWPLELLRATPPIAIGPLTITLLGVGNAPAIVVVAFGAFFPIYQSLRFGTEHIDKGHLEIARCFGASRRVRWMHVIVPTLTAHALSGLQAGLGVGWFCVVAAEMLGASAGLGFRLQNLSLNLATDGMWCYLLVIGVVGWAMVALARSLFDRVAPWRRERIAA
ncbi:MAG: ABC transporter permease subunit [Burkholderiales bacterium]|jgi:ABC-type nitrate/sulfonate/bicarbonate transport system permease component|nr:ABC transporter permease subunit [Burkholderiales bacterium]